MSTEQIELSELSKKVLTSYLAKGLKSKNAAYKSLDKENKKPLSSDSGERMDALKKKTSIIKTIGNRTKGAKMALSKVSESDLAEYTIEELEEFMMTEEFEQLDELSKKTLGSYIKKSAVNLRMNSYKTGASDNNQLFHATNKLMKESEDFQVLINAIAEGDSEKSNEVFAALMADRISDIVDTYRQETMQSIFESEELSLEDYSKEELEEFMMTEEFEQLDELSKDMLSSYLPKALSNQMKQERKGKAYAKIAAHTDNDKTWLHAIDKGTEAHTDLEKRKRGIKSAIRKMKESEEVNELSKNTLGSYYGKAVKDASKHALGRHKALDDMGKAKTQDEIISASKAASNASHKKDVRSSGLVRATKRTGEH